MLHAELETSVGELELYVELDVPSGGCLALVGPSGAGKTSILRFIAGITTPRRGLVSCGEEVWLDSERSVCAPPQRRRCGYVFQDYALFPHLSTWRNVAYGLRDGPRRRRRALALELLERLGVGDRAEDRPGRLSGGERPRVALARALACEPEVLLLDEPLSALDTQSRAAATRMLAEILRATETPTILVTHDFHEAALLGDRVGVLDRGKIVQCGAASDLAASPASSFVAELTGAVVLTGLARRIQDGLTEIELDGGGFVTATASGEGRVAVSIYPWEIVLQAPTDVVVGSAQNRIAARVSSMVTVGNRVRVGLSASQPLVAEVTRASAERLGLAEGSEVLATWKATATRLGEL
jgi:molybdenum ABC transporter ATP-binding protein